MLDSTSCKDSEHGIHTKIRCQDITRCTNEITLLIDLPVKGIDRLGIARHLATHTAVSHTCFDYYSKSYRTCNYYWHQKQSIWIFKDIKHAPIECHKENADSLVCLICSLDCHMNTRHHHMACQHKAITRAWERAREGLYDAADEPVDKIFTEIENIKEPSPVACFRDQLNKELRREELTKQKGFPKTRQYNKHISTPKQWKTSSKWLIQILYKCWPRCCAIGLVSPDPTAAHDDNI